MDELKKATTEKEVEAEINFGEKEFRLPGQGVIKQETGEAEGLESSAGLAGAEDLAGATGEPSGEPEKSESEQLVSPGIREDLMKSRITGLSVPEEAACHGQSYLIDVTGCKDGIDKPKTTALRLLTKESGTKRLYLQTGTNCFLIGKIDAFLAYELLEKILKLLFDGDVKLYYQEQAGDGFKLIRNIKLSDVQLDL